MKPSHAARWKLRQIDAIGLVICIAAAVPFCFARVNPLLRSTGQAAEQGDRLAGLREQAERLSRSARAHTDRLAGLQEVLQHENVTLQPARQINRRLALLTGLAATAGLEVDEVLPGQAERCQDYQAIPISVRGTGGYPTCVAFLSKLMGRFRDMSVESFELSGQPQKPGEPAGFHLSLCWYAAAAARPEDE